MTEKGGVGKTTTTIHLGGAFAIKGKKTLLIDFDTQADLTTGFKIEDDFDYSIYNFLNEDFEGFTLCKKSDNLYILAGKTEIGSLDFKRDFLSKNIQSFENYGFEYVVIDCPPSSIIESKLGLGEISLCASDYVLSPITAEQFAIKGINKLLPSIERIKKDHNSKLIFLGFFFNQVSELTLNFKKYYRLANEEVPDDLLKSYVRKDMAFTRAIEAGDVVFKTEPKSRASIDFNNLVEEIILKIEENEK